MSTYQYELGSVLHGVSLVDVTATGVTRGSGLERNQQRNWETVLQTIGILSQVITINEPQKHIFTKHDELYQIIGTRHQFVMEMLQPEQAVWVFTVGSEHTDVFESIENVFDNVPVITGLEETASINPSVFTANDSENKNIAFLPIANRL